MKKGSITIAVVVSIAVPMFLAGMGYLISLRNKHEEDVRDIRVELGNKGEEISALEANVGSLKEDTKVIKEDIKELLQRIPKK